ncbi:MAG: hypothetical protein ACOZBH_00155 [Patescibacteria group bacterium]
MSPCEVHTAIYNDFSIQSRGQVLHSDHGACEFADRCEILRAEFSAVSVVDEQLQQFRKRKLGSRPTQKDIEASRKSLIAALRRKHQRHLHCFKRIAHQMASDIISMKMGSLKLTFEQAVIDAIIEYCRLYQRSTIQVFDYDADRFLKVDRIKGAWGEIIDLLMAIMGVYPIIAKT